MSDEQAQAIVYYQIYTNGKLVSLGNIQVSYTPNDPKLSEIWRDWIAKEFGYKQEEIFFIGVFKL